MKAYRVTFLMNEITALSELNKGELPQGNSYYEHDGLLAYALIEAENAKDARVKAKEIIRTVNTKYGRFG